jgi:acyl-CoA thioesterase-2
VDVCAFLGLEQGEDPTRARLPISEAVCTPMGTLYGGAGLAAGVAAMEEATARPVIWATAQFLASGAPPVVAELEVTPAAEGAAVSQARVVGRVEGIELFVVTGAFGERPLEATGRWLSPPEVPAPHECPERIHWRPVLGGIAERFEVRLAEGRQPHELDGSLGSGRTVLWARLPELDSLSGPALGLLADHVPFGIGQAFGRRASGTSLDTTLRVVTLVPTDWVLLDVRIVAVDRGIAHGHMVMWAEDGTLLATASQSAVVRFWQE